MRIFPVKYISAWSSAKIKESYILQLVFLKCFLPPLARDTSKQEGLNNFFLMTGYMISHLSKCGDIHVHMWILAPEAEITLQFLQVWLDCEAGSATRKGLKKMARDPFQLPRSSDCRQTLMHPQAAHASRQNPPPRNADVQFSAQAPWTAPARGSCRVLQYCKALQYSQFTGRFLWHRPGTLPSLQPL